MHIAVFGSAGWTGRAVLANLDGKHTIRAIGLLAGIESDRLINDHPVACAIVKEVQSRAALYVSVLLHDIAKGRGGDHSELGAEIALKLCPRLGLNDWETETVSWLVRSHLMMSNVPLFVIRSLF